MNKPDKAYWDKITVRLSSKDRSERAAAIQELAKRDEIQAIRLLLSGLKDFSSSNRKMIGDILIEKDNPFVVSGLIALLDSDQFLLKQTASDILKSMSPQKTIPEIQKRIMDPNLDESLRVELIPILAKGDSEELEELFRSYLSSGNDAIKNAAVRGLIQANASWRYPILLDLLDSSDAELVNQAKEGLVKYSPPDVLDRLVELLRLPGRKGLCALEILSRLNNNQVVEKLIPLTSDDNSVIRERVLVLINSLDPEKAAYIASNMLNDESEEIRGKALGILESRPSEIVIAAMEGLFPGETESFNENGAYLLARTNSEPAKFFLDMVFQGMDDIQRRALMRGIIRANSQISQAFIQDHINEIEDIGSVIPVFSQEKNAVLYLFLLDLIEQSETPDLIRMELIRNYRPEMKTVLLDNLEGAPTTRQKNAILLLARVGEPDVIERLRVFKPGHPFYETVQDSIVEIEFRHRLQSRGWNPRNNSIESIEAIASSKGWNSASGLSLMELLRSSIRTSGLAAQRNQLQDELQKFEKVVQSAEPKIRKIRDFLDQSNRFRMTRFLYLGFTIIFILGAMYCFYRNWQKNAAPYWYPSMVLFTISGGVMAFRFNRYQQKVMKSINVSDPQKTLSELEEKVRISRMDSEPTRLRLKEIDSRLSELNANRVERDLDSLIKTVVEIPFE